jgi:hypothetical protein
MGTRGQSAEGDPYAEARSIELRAGGELPDEAGAGRVNLVVGSMIGLLMLLAAFFVAFAPGM